MDKQSEVFQGLVCDSQQPPEEELWDLFDRAHFHVPDNYKDRWFTGSLTSISVRDAVTNQLVAYTSVRSLDFGLEWQDLAVDPGYQQRGIGRALGDAIIEKARLLPAREPWMKLYAKPAHGLADRYRTLHGFHDSDDGMLVLELTPVE